MKNFFKKYFYLAVVYFLMPATTYAQKPGSDVKSLLNFFRNMFNKRLIPILMTLGLVYLIFAVIGYIGASEDTAKREEKKKQIFSGIIGLFIIMTVWALVGIVGNTFNIFRGGSLQTR